MESKFSQCVRIRSLGRYIARETGIPLHCAIWFARGITRGDTKHALRRTAKKWNLKIRLIPSGVRRDGAGGYLYLLVGPKGNYCYHSE